MSGTDERREPEDIVAMVLQRRQQLHEILGADDYKKRVATGVAILTEAMSQREEENPFKIMMELVGETPELSDVEMNVLVCAAADMVVDSKVS